MSVFAFEAKKVVVAEAKKTGIIADFCDFELLSSVIKERHLVGAKAFAMLAPEHYQLLRINIPAAVTKEQILTYLWQEQEKFFLPANQVVLDYVSCPSLHNEKRVYVTVVAKRDLTEVHQSLLAANLVPMKITLPEFVYALYAKKYYPTAATVIWVNYFQEFSQVLAFHQGELLALLRLPSIKKVSNENIAALQMFYLSEIKAFSAAPLWLFNTTLSCDGSVIDLLSGDKQQIHAASLASCSLDGLKASLSHAYFGAKLYE